MSGIAVGFFNQGGSTAAQVLLLKLDDEVGIERLAALSPESVQVGMADDAGKEALGELIRDMLTTGHPVRGSILDQVRFAPDMVVQVSEAWVLHTDISGAEKVERGEMRVSASPDRKEVVLVTMHMHGRTELVMHPIVETPTRHCKLAAFPDQSEMTGEFWGRFSMRGACMPEMSEGE